MEHHDRLTVETLAEKVRDEILELEHTAGFLEDVDPDDHEAAELQSAMEEAEAQLAVVYGSIGALLERVRRQNLEATP